MRINAKFTVIIGALVLCGIVMMSGSPWAQDAWPASVAGKPCK
jgi:hypothetical protein